MSKRCSRQHQLLSEASLAPTHLRTSTALTVCGLQLTTVESAWQRLEDPALVSKSHIPRMTLTQEPVNQRVIVFHIGVCAFNNRLGCVVAGRRWSTSKCVASRWCAAHVNRSLAMIYATFLVAFVVVLNFLLVVDHIGRSTRGLLRIEGRSRSRVVHVV